MPNKFIFKETISLKVIFQFVAGVVFLIIGVYILLTDFNNNYVLVGTTKLLFGGILCLYGLIRVVRIYLNLKSKKEKYYEISED